jgi:hypothetical protein
MPGRQRKITMRPQTSGSAPEKYPDIVIVGRLYSLKIKIAIRAPSWPLSVGPSQIFQRLEQAAPIGSDQQITPDRLPTRGLVRIEHVHARS